MNRIRAVLAVGLGLALIGIALGLLYMDVRQHAAAQMLLEAAGPTQQDKATAIQTWQKSDRVLKALLAGASGAALLGMGLMLAVFEMRTFRRA